MDDEPTIETQVRLDLPLQYQRKVLKDIYLGDGLVVLARGLGLPLIIANLLHAINQPGALVVLLGADQQEELWLGEKLTEFPDSRGMLNVINSDATGVEKREKMYSHGGIFSVTSRILVVDFLTSIMDPEKVAGIVVLKAEKVTATSSEAFILRLFRQKNKDGFIKAFSDQPEPFAMGFAPLATSLRNLFVRSAYLWPRFHKDIADNLEHRKADVIELEVMMTPSMRDIQIAILECIEAVMGEIKKAHSQDLDLEEWSTDAALHRNFDQIVRRQLDPVWHRVSFRVKQLISDLSSLRVLLQAVLTYDCVTFNKYIENIFETNNTATKAKHQDQSAWLFLEAANTIFTLARRRVYKSKSGSELAVGVLPPDLESTLEEQPKWEQLAEALKEIHENAHFNPPSDSANSTILIMCSDMRTCSQIKQYLETMHSKDLEGTDDPSGKILLKRKFAEYLNWKESSKTVNSAIFQEKFEQEKAKEAQKRGASTFRGRGAPMNKRRRVRGGSATAATPGRPVPAEGVIDLTALAEEMLDGDESAAKQDGQADPLENMEDYYELLDLDDLVVVMPYDGDNDDRILEELKPRHVIMYELDSAFIRRIEIYRAIYPSINLRVYFMFYGGSVEEQRYLSIIRREKDAFTRLIKEKGSMALTLTHHNAAENPEDHFLRTINTRIAGGGGGGGRTKATAQPPHIIVDVREFRSSLPSLLHARAQRLIPCQLTVGDYILTPDICIERKSLKDLISSFQSGRLFNQCEQMTQYYKTPVVLIEFDANKSFHLDPFSSFDKDTNHSGGGTADLTSLQSKLVLLALSFPKMKFIWSSSPFETAEIFELLKRSNGEPDPMTCVNYGLVDPNSTAVKNSAAMEFLESMPGVSAKNSWNVSSRVENVRELVGKSVEEMVAMIGPERGRMLSRFLIKDVTASTE